MPRKILYPPEVREAMLARVRDCLRYGARITAAIHDTAREFRMPVNTVANYWYAMERKEQGLDD